MEQRRPALAVDRLDVRLGLDELAHARRVAVRRRLQQRLGFCRRRQRLGLLRRQPVLRLQRLCRQGGEGGHAEHAVGKQLPLQRRGVLDLRRREERCYRFGRLEQRADGLMLFLARDGNCGTMLA